MDRGQLAHFLRTRREALQPEDVDLVRGPYRRVHGLRREEVAALSGMSTDYYARIEQRRGPVPSGPVLDRLAEALRLSTAERDHLFRMAGRDVPQRPSVGVHVSGGMRRLLARLGNVPARIVTPAAETLLQTDAAITLFGDETRYTGFARSLVYRWFTDPEVRRLYPEADHLRHGRAFTAQLRAARSLQGEESSIGRLVQALSDRSPEFAHMWERHEVTVDYDGYHKAIRHRELGHLDLYCQLLFDSTGSQALLAYTALPGTESSAALQSLGRSGGGQ